MFYHRQSFKNEGLPAKLMQAEPPAARMLWADSAGWGRSLRPAISPTPLAAALVMPAADCMMHGES